MNDNVTLVVIDSKQYDATTWAINHTRKFFPKNPLLVFSDEDFYPKRDKFIKVNKFDAVEHSKICLQNVGDHVETSHALFIQYDGMPVNEQSWTDEYMEYDYIGAPWVDWLGLGRYRVGNGGFSLRSKQLMRFTLHIQQQFENVANTGLASWWKEDGLIGIHCRDWLVSCGIKFAPIELAAQFSHEFPVGKTNSFGFHDKTNAELFLNKEQYTEWTKLVKE
jgi:hypothetical protein